MYSALPAEPGSKAGISRWQGRQAGWLPVAVSTQFALLFFSFFFLFWWPLRSTSFWGPSPSTSSRSALARSLARFCHESRHEKDTETPAQSHCKLRASVSAQYPATRSATLPFSWAGHAWL
ncbi:hypothetical protein GQ53DRAFT_461236 [Thozetella sp. PMI_491]|nr:hypothetical protein GQ53DRAFT_461236 [Thozetella sp. PMI_491]